MSKAHLLWKSLRDSERGALAVPFIGSAYKTLQSGISIWMFGPNVVTFVCHIQLLPEDVLGVSGQNSRGLGGSQKADG